MNKLTLNMDFAYNPLKNEGGLSMAGHIRCSKCRHTINGPLCGCGSVKVHISLYSKGKHYKVGKDREGDILTYYKAKRLLENIRSEIDRKKFDITNWLPGKIRERLFINKMDEWLALKENEVETKELAPETFRCYQSYTKNHYKPFNSMDVRDITFADLEVFKDKLPGHLKIKSKKNILNALKSFFVWLRKKGVVKEVPLFPEIKGDDATVRIALDYDDQAEALKKIPEDHKDIIEFMFETGLRIAEACSLKISDIDTKEGKALIQRTYSGSVLKENTKANSKKWIPLSDKAIEIVLKNSHSKHPGLFLFINSATGRGYRQEFLRRLWHKYSDLDVTLYESTRHSFCTQIAESGICNTLQARELMRHSDIRSTEKYFHGSIPKLRDIVNSRGKIIELRKPKGNEKETSLSNVSN